MSKKHKRHPQPESRPAAPSLDPEPSLDDELAIAAQSDRPAHEIAEMFLPRLAAKFPEKKPEELRVLVHVYLTKKRKGDDSPFSIVLTSPPFPEAADPEPEESVSFAPAPHTETIEIKTGGIESEPPALEAPPTTPVSDPPPEPFQHPIPLPAMPPPPPPEPEPVQRVAEASGDDTARMLSEIGEAMKAGRDRINAELAPERERLAMMLVRARAQDLVDVMVQIFTLDPLFAEDHAQSFFEECITKHRYETAAKLLAIPGWHIKQMACDDFARNLIERRETRSLFALIEKGGTSVGFEKQFWSCLAMGRSVRIFSDEFLASSGISLRHAIEFGSQTRMTIQIGRTTDPDLGRGERMMALDEQLNAGRSAKVASSQPERTWLQRVINFLSLNWLPSRE